MKLYWMIWYCTLLSFGCGCKFQRIFDGQSCRFVWEKSRECDIFPYKFLNSNIFFLFPLHFLRWSKSLSNLFGCYVLVDAHGCDVSICSWKRRWRCKTRSCQEEEAKEIEENLEQNNTEEQAPVWTKKKKPSL